MFNKLKIHELLSKAQNPFLDHYCDAAMQLGYILQHKIANNNLCRRLGSKNHRM